MSFDLFHPLVADWFAGRFGEPTAAQRRGWPAIAAGDDTLIAAPTGSGKTLAAFLWCIDGLLRRAERARGPDLRRLCLAAEVPVARHPRQPRGAARRAGRARRRGRKFAGAG